MSEGKTQRKPKEGGSWKQFWSFFRKVKLSWGWIILSLAVSIAYYAVVTMIPGSTAALYAGDFTTAAIMGLVINYAGTLVLSLASALSQLMADARSVRAARNSVWKQMMGIETSYYSENDPGRLLSAVTSDTEAAVSALIRLIIGIPSLGIYLMMCMGQIFAYNPKLLGVLFVLVPVYILYAVFMGRWVQKTGYAIQSRMFKLIERLYDPQEGTVRFGSTDAGEYSLTAWRKTFGVVAQGSPLMEGTIRENICYGCERPVSQEELEKIAKQSRVYDFVSRLPDGFDTMVTSGGQNFSGGQRQCIAIARAMMCAPDYLLLDEATSNLDARSERAVMEALDELMRDRTTVIIAHSLSAIRKADHVIVLRDGEVEASGSPKQIMEASGNYLAKVMDRKRPEMA